MDTQCRSSSGSLEAMSRAFKLTLAGRTYDVEVGDLSENPVTVVVDGWEHKVTVPDTELAAPAPMPTSRPARPQPPRPATPTPVPSAAPSTTTGGDSALRAPMPGRVVRVNVSVGDSVSAGDALVVLESMKMENTLSSSEDGTVRAVHVAADDSVQQGQTLVEFE